MTEPVGNLPAETVHGLLALWAVAILRLWKRAKQPREEVAYATPLNVAETMNAVWKVAMLVNVSRISTAGTSPADAICLPLQESRHAFFHRSTVAVAVPGTQKALKEAVYETSTALVQLAGVPGPAGPAHP